jgi:hypothetical protein
MQTFATALILLALPRSYLFAAVLDAELAGLLAAVFAVFEAALVAAAATAVAWPLTTFQPSAPLCRTSVAIMSLVRGLPLTTPFALTVAIATAVSPYERTLMFS